MKILPVFIACFVLLSLTACFDKTQKPATVSAYGSTEGVGSLGVHTVQPGDTVWSITQRYDIAMRDLVNANNLAPPYRLVNGQRLKLPAPYEYKARTGDSITGIARMFRASPSDLVKLNNLRAPYNVVPGEIIKLPAANARAAVSVAGLEDAPPGEVASVGEVMSEPLAPTPGQSASSQILPPESSPAPFESASIPSAEPVENIATPTKRSPITAKTPARSSGKFLRPVHGRVISGYGPKADGFHNDGINIAAAKGTPVKAAENGVVVYADNKLKGSGNLVLIRHENRWMTAYAHMDKIKVKRGDVVKYGQEIGTVGSTGSVDSPQLHFELRRGTEALNPQVYLE